MITIKLDKGVIQENMYDGPTGCHVLAVDPNGGEISIHWMEMNRQFDPWPAGSLIAGIPAINPDGSGRELEDAQECLSHSGKLEEAEALMEAEDIGYTEAADRLIPEEWAIDRAESLDWLATEWLAALNGEPNDLNIDAPLGYRNLPDDIETIECPFKFAWAD